MTEQLTQGLAELGLTELSPELSSWREALAEQLMSLLDLGGPVLLILLLFSVLALAIVLLKTWQFARQRIAAQGFARRALVRWRSGNTTEALRFVSRRRSPLARVLTVAMHGLSEQTLAEATLREEVQRVAAQELENLRSHLRLLELIASLSPLLGLLGTVLGMIEAFQQLEQAGSRVNPALLSGGIWQALLTTAVGLAVAIPAVLALAWFERRVERCAHLMENCVTQVFTQRPLFNTLNPVNR